MWCPKKASCRARHNYANQTAADIFKTIEKIDSGNDVPIIELTETLAKAANYEQYIKDIRAYIQHKIEQGEDVDGWKLVPGRSIRRWIDPEVAENHLSLMFDYDALYTAKFVSPAQAEKLQRGMKKEDWFLDLVEKPEGKPTLVIEADKRKAISYRTPGEIFKEIEDESENI